jgi:hypothetical protein
MNPWLIAGGIGGALLLVAGGAKARPMGSSTRDRDLDALADLLWTETSFRLNKGEMAQIVWIAVNRARNQRRSIWAVVQPGFAPRGSCPSTPTTRCLAWNAKGSLYKRRFENARSKAEWPAARAFAAQVISGRSPYPNLGKTSFVHPRAMPTPPCASNRVATSTTYGTRCLPRWIVGGKQIGSAIFA